MSATSLSYIFSRIQMTNSEGAVLQAILSVANMWGQNARMAHVAMAGATGLSERTTYRVIAALETRHLLRVKRRWDGPKHQEINVYTVVLPWLREFDWREAWKRKKNKPVRSATRPAQRST